MLRRRFNFNDLFSEFDSLFDGFNSYSNPMMVRGKKNVESGDDENGTWTKETFTSDDGSYQITSIYRYNTEVPTKDSIEVNELKQQLNSAVESQDYESAAKIRDLIKSMGVKIKKRFMSYNLNLMKQFQNRSLRKQLNFEIN